MGHFRATIILLVASLAVIWTGARDLKADQTPSLIVHFEPGKIQVGGADKTELRKFFESYTLGPEAKVFVVGYTDATGPATGNRKLSRQRAQSVRHTIVTDCGIDAGMVIALGKGARMPVADNKTIKGRALNRRVEIFLANGQARKPPPAFGPDSPHWSEITEVVREAEQLIKARRMADALQKLKKAHALGADRYSQWHAALGIAGFYAEACLEQTRAHLAAALDLDPYNSKAREYLSRVDARVKVARAQVTKDMGRSAETAIVISDLAQQYEYLRLFEVEPQAHRVLEGQPVDRWQCLDRQGAPVVYYFDHSRVFRWALAESPPSDANLRSARDDGADGTGKQIPGRIWESKLFR